MSICTECGKSMEEEARYCSNCGKPTSEEASFIRKKSKSKLNIAIIELGNIFKKLTLKPIATIEQVKDILSQESTIILTLVLACINGLLSMWAMKAFSTILLNKISSVFRAYLENIYMLLSGGNLPMNANITLKIAYDKLFLYSTLSYLVFAGTLFVALFIFYKYMLKGRDARITLWKLAVVTTIPLVVAEFLAMCLLYISPLISIGIIIFAIVFSALILSKGFNCLVEEKENKIIYIVPLVYFLAILITCIVLSFMLKSLNISIINPFIPGATA
ncbi:MAG TPA: zinc ribbon domain-containing protein [Clostridiaceae bacterium]